LNALIHILTKSGLLTQDLDYHLIRASMVLIFLSTAVTSRIRVASLANAAKHLAAESRFKPERRGSGLFFY
jgi:hypothetical protein